MIRFLARHVRRKPSVRSLIRDIERVERRIERKALQAHARVRDHESGRLVATAVVGFGLGAALGALARTLVHQRNGLRTS